MKTLPRLLFALAVALALPACTNLDWRLYIEVVHVTPTPDAPGAILTASPTNTPTLTPTATSTPVSVPPTASPTPTATYTPTITPTIDYEWQDVETVYTLRLREDASASSAIQGQASAGTAVRVSRAGIVFASPECDDDYHGPYIWAVTETNGITAWMAVAVMTGTAGHCLISEWWVTPAFDFGFYGFPTPTPEHWTPGPTMTPDARYAGCTATTREGHRLVWQPGQSTPFPSLLHGTYVPVRGACCKEGNGLWYLVELGEVYRLAHEDSLALRGCPALEECTQ